MGTNTTKIICVEQRTEEVDLGKIVNTHYQRPIVPSNVRKIVNAFKPAMLGVLIVSRRDDGSYAVLDGQHRLSALRTLGYTHALSIVQEGMTPEDEADYFRRQNENSRPLTSYDLYNAGIVAKDPHFLAIEAILNSYGFCASRKSGPMQITAVSALSRIVSMFGFDVLDRTLGIIAATWPTGATVLKREMLAGIADFAARFKQVTPDMFAHRMRDEHPSALFYEYRRRTDGRATARNAFNETMRYTLCSVLVEAYNKGLSGRSKSRLTLSWRMPAIEHSEGGGWS